MADLEGCTCGRLAIGMEVSVHRNWNPDCPEHGVHSKWYASPEQVAKREADNETLRELLERAKEARDGS